MKRYPMAPLALSACLALGACGAAESAHTGTRASLTQAASLARLDCGTNRNGSKAAFRRFTAILRGGDRAAVRSVLADRGEFGWISAQHGSHLNVSVKNDPGEAAREVARFGGLPLEIKRFYNIEAPRRTTDAGFNGTWGDDQRFVGKGALNCHEGKAIVLSVAVQP